MHGPANLDTSLYSLYLALVYKLFKWYYISTFWCVLQLLFKLNVKNICSFSLRVYDCLLVVKPFNWRKCPAAVMFEASEFSSDMVFVSLRHNETVN